MPGRTLLPNLSKFITFAAASLVLTPFVRNQVWLGEAVVEMWERHLEDDDGKASSRPRSLPSPYLPSLPTVPFAAVHRIYFSDPRV